jgi:transposase-like protein
MAKQQQRGSRAAFWREKVAEQERSGLTVRGYCRQTGLNEHSFYNWRAQLRRRAGPERSVPPATVQFALIEPEKINVTGPARIEITLPGGEQIRIGAGADAATVRLVLAALRAAP